MAGSSPAQKRWELENSIQNIEGSDAYYVYDGAEQQALQHQKPWTKDPHYFKQCVSDHRCCWQILAASSQMNASLYMLHVSSMLLCILATAFSFACSVRISALALLKMAMHAKSGGNLEIMGMLYGKIQDDAFIVVDAFALPVEGTETRVNAQAEAYEFMVDFNESTKVCPPASPFQPIVASYIKLDILPSTNAIVQNIGVFCARFLDHVVTCR